MNVQTEQELVYYKKMAKVTTVYVIVVQQAAAPQYIISYITPLPCITRIKHTGTGVLLLKCHRYLAGVFMFRPLMETQSCVTSVSCVSAGSGGAAGITLSCGASTQRLVSG